MSSEADLTRNYEHGCVRKRRYATKNQARAALSTIKRKNPDTRTADLNVYRCPVCRDFHVGHAGPPPSP